MRLTTDFGDHIGEFLHLEAQASEPYSKFVYYNAEQAMSVVRLLWDRNLCEFSPPNGRLLLDDNRVLGMIATQSAHDLTGHRLRAGYALKKSGLLDRDVGLLDRLRMANATLLRPAPQDLYLSRIAVAATARAAGLGRFLIERVIAEAVLGKCERVVLEVASTSSALAFYQHIGFCELARKSAFDPATKRRLIYVHMACDVNSA